MQLIYLIEDLDLLGFIYELVPKTAIVIFQITGAVCKFRIVMNVSCF